MSISSGDYTRRFDLGRLFFFKGRIVWQPRTQRIELSYRQTDDNKTCKNESTQKEIMPFILENSLYEKVLFHQKRGIGLAITAVAKWILFHSVGCMYSTVCVNLMSISLDLSAIDQ